MDHVITVTSSMIHRMSFDDFKRNFTDIEICNITLDQFDEDQSSELLLATI